MAKNSLKISISSNFQWKRNGLLYFQSKASTYIWNVRLRSLLSSIPASFFHFAIQKKYSHQVYVQTASAGSKSFGTKCLFFI